MIEKTRLETNITNQYLVGPFQEFNQRWYLVLGAPITLTIILQILTPHLDIVVQFLFQFTQRCLDRGCGCNSKSTKKVVQSDYEDLYTGPEYIL